MLPLNTSSLCRRLACIAAAVVAFSSPGQAANGSVVYTYDPLGRVSSAFYDTGVCITYTYDPNGNRTSEKIIVLPVTGVGYWNCFNWNVGKWN